MARRRLVATEACRRADNGAEFIDAGQTETGLELEIIERETEAHLAATGAEPLIDPAAPKRLDLRYRRRLDRTDVARPRGGRIAIAAWTSLAAGVVTVSERFGGPVSRPNPSSRCALHLRPILRSSRDR